MIRILMMNPFTYSVPVDRLTEMAEVTADAFIGNDDPIGNYIFADEPGHMTLKRRFFRSIVTSCSSQTIYQASSSRMEAVAIWFPPGMDHSEDVDVDPFLDSDFINPGTMGRMQNVVDVIDALTADLGHEPQWYMHLIAVAPEYAGMHFASRLLMPMIKRAENEGLPCSLITQRMENVKRYEHWGFKVVKEMGVKDSKERFYSMKKL